MANILKPKRRSADATAPTTSNLADGEMAVNTFSKKWYMRVGAAIVDMCDWLAPIASPTFSGVVTLAGNLINATASSIFWRTSADSQLLVRDSGGTTTVDAVNAANSAFKPLRFEALSYTLAGGQATFASSPLAPTPATATNSGNVATTAHVWGVANYKVQINSTVFAPGMFDPGSVQFNPTTKAINVDDGSGNPLTIANYTNPSLFVNARAVYKLGVAHSNSTVTPTTITDGTTPWSFAVTAGQSYRLTVIGNYQAAATTTGCKLQITATTAVGSMAGSLYGAIAQAVVATGLEGTFYSVSAGAAGSFVLTTGVSPANSPHSVGLDVIFNCTTSGTLAIQFASEVALSAAQLNIGSTLLVDNLSTITPYTNVVTAYKTAAQTMTTGVSAPISFDAASPNDLGMWSAGAPTRLTVPAGVSRVKLCGGVRFGGSATGSRWYVLRKNGATAARGFSDFRLANGVTVCDFTASTGVLDVSPGDYFDVLASQDSGGNLDVAATGAGTWLSMELIR